MKPIGAADRSIALARGSIRNVLRWLAGRTQQRTHVRLKLHQHGFPSANPRITSSARIAESACF
jgi:hypothetical protein